MITYFDLLSFVVNDIFYDGTDAILIHIVFTLGGLWSSRYNGEGNPGDRHTWMLTILIDIIRPGSFRCTTRQDVRVVFCMVQSLNTYLLAILYVRSCIRTKFKEIKVSEGSV